MAFREVSVNEIREVLRVWLGVAGLPAPGTGRSPRIAVWTAKRCAAMSRPPRQLVCAATVVPPRSWRVS